MLLNYNVEMNTKMLLFISARGTTLLLIYNHFYAVKNNMRTLIINADDFGYSQERNAGIVECFKRSVVTNVSLMVNGVAVDDAVRLSKLHNIPTGLHLNLTEGVSVKNKQYTTLTDAKGHFHGIQGTREVNKNGSLSMAEVKEEMQAQLDKFQELMGKMPVHVDGHQHIHVVPGVSEVFACTLSENNIQSSRLPLEEKMDGHPWPSSDWQCSMENLVREAHEAKYIFQKYNIRTPDHFFGLKTMGQGMTLAQCEDDLSHIFKEENGLNTEQVSCEWMVHPGQMTKGQGGCGTGADDFSKSPDREHEISILCSDELDKMLKKLQINKISFEDLKRSG